MRTGFVERTGKIEEMDRRFDLIFWQTQSDARVRDPGESRLGDVGEVPRFWANCLARATILASTLRVSFFMYVSLGRSYT